MRSRHKFITAKGKKLLQLSFVTFIFVVTGNIHASKLTSINNTEMNEMNPLLSEFATPFATVPFDKIRNEHFLPAFDNAIADAKVKLESIRNNPSPPDFENTIEALEQADNKVNHLAQIFFNLNSAETNEELQKIAKDLAPKINEFSNDITLDQKLFLRIKTVYEGTKKEDLTPEQYQLLDKTYKNFTRRGANLNDEDKETFRKITRELSVLSLRFSENVLAETNGFILHLTDEKDLSGIPADIRKTAAAEASERNLSGWVFTLKTPSYIPFLKYADNRELRRKLFLAYNSRGRNGNDHDNRDIIKEITRLRLEEAKLLGYATFADYVLENRMAETTGQVITFLDELREYYYPNAMTEVEEVTVFAKTAGADTPLERWDWSYYSEKLREQKFNVTDEALKPYFRLENVQKAIFDLTGKLYGITFSENKQIPVYHKDVKAYEVYDENNSFLAVLYLDFFPRKGKNSGAWMTEFLQQHKQDGKDIRPHTSLVFNFTPASDEKPSLLTHSEVTTFLHEIGHALHGMFSKVTYESLAGTEVYRDFVELPSQIMENWANKKEWINTFANHYITGEKIPDDQLSNLIEGRNFIVSFLGSRQLTFAYLDMDWHTLNTPWNGTIDELERKSTSRTNLLPEVEETAISTSFNHIFAGGYASGYYSYKWAEVLDADAFMVFEENGIYNTDVAKRFRDCILSKGGTEHPMKLYTDFRGREPSTEALLKRSGLIVEKETMPDRARTERN